MPEEQYRKRRRRCAAHEAFRLVVRTIVYAVAIVATSVVAASVFGAGCGMTDDELRLYRDSFTDYRGGVNEVFADPDLRNDPAVRQAVALEGDSVQAQIDAALGLEPAAPTILPPDPPPLADDEDDDNEEDDDVEVVSDPGGVQ